MEAIFHAIDEINDLLPLEKHLIKSPATVLFGLNGKLSSIEFVSFIVEVEQSIEENLEITLTIANEKAFSQENNPFKTVQTLTDYLVTLLSK